LVCISEIFPPEMCIVESSTYISVDIMAKKLEIYGFNKKKL
jgi:hypothetical protein